MYKIILSILLIGGIGVQTSYAEPSKKLPLPQELQAKQVPFFAFTAKDNAGAYNEVINRDVLETIIKQRKSKRVVFAFFATWCLECKVGLKIISDNSEKLKKNNVLVLLANVLDKKSYAEIDEWLIKEGYIKEDWLQGFQQSGTPLKKFGLLKDGEEVLLPRTLITDANLRPIMLIGSEGNDYLKLLLGEL